MKPLKPTGVSFLSEVPENGHFVCTGRGRERRGTTTKFEPRTRGDEKQISCSLPRKRTQRRALALLCSSTRIQCTHGCTMRVTRDESLWILKIEIYLSLRIHASRSDGRFPGRYILSIRNNFSFSLCNNCNNAKIIKY